VTGIAGPGGATKDKPVGLVYVGLSGPGKKAQVWKCRFSGDRAQVQERSAQAALDHLRRTIMGSSKFKVPSS
jgi:nicotinamide mononucleotide (NMN) deamidase PncC